MFNISYLYAFQIHIFSSLAVGLDGAGKTTILNRLKLGKLYAIDTFNGERLFCIVHRPAFYLFCVCVIICYFNLSVNLGTQRSLVYNLYDIKFHIWTMYMSLSLFVC